VKDVIDRVIRELPDTDKDRYDIAYQRGRAQVRSTYILGGLLAGLAGGVAGMFLLDPERGNNRRSELLERVRTQTTGAGGTMGERARDLRERFGIGQQEGGSAEGAVEDVTSLERSLHDTDVPTGDRPMSTGGATDATRPVAAGTIADPETARA
jgi:hypothetical protein